jgi:hypothetical protein
MPPDRFDLIAKDIAFRRAQGWPATVDTLAEFADDIARALREAVAEERLACADAAYSVPSYVRSTELDEEGLLKPGSPYDRGRRDARRAVLARGEGAAGKRFNIANLKPVPREAMEADMRRRRDAGAAEEPDESGAGTGGAT